MAVADPSDQPADWYLDPSEPTRGRYWDGARWTTHTVDVPEGLTLRTFGPQPDRPMPRGSSRERAVLLAVVVGLVAFAGAVVFAIAREDQPSVPAAVAGKSVARLRGTVQLESAAFVGLTRDAPCHGDGEFADLKSGLAVTIGAGDRVIARTTIGAGHLVPSASGVAKGVDAMILACQFDFRADVPVVASYRVSVAGYGSQTYSRPELERQDWQAALTVTG